MGELIRLLIDIAQWAFPLRAVEQWERGCYYVLGKYWKTVGPGRWPVIPYFMDVRAVSIVPGVVPVQLQTVTLRDGVALSFAASVMFRVTDAASALNKIERYEETVSEQAAGLLAERLADVDPDRFDPAYGKRDRLLKELVAELNRQTSAYGVEVMEVWMRDFAMGIKTYRLLNQTSF